jgi:cytosine deaminase
LDNFWLQPPGNDQRYVLANVRIPPALSSLGPSQNGWCEADVLISEGTIETVAQSGLLPVTDAKIIDADNGILLSGLVDCHTHLDKAHVAAFADFPPCNLTDAIDAMVENKKTWTAENLAARVEFSLQSAYASGVRALRSHVDFSPDMPDFVWGVMHTAIGRWKNRIELQLSPLANIIHFDDPVFCQRIYDTASRQGILGLFIYDQSNLITRLTPVFEYANSQGWDIDLHVDEGLDASLDGLIAVAEVTLATKFKGRVLCGHCVALNTYDETRRRHVITRSLEAGLHFVSLPVTNLYLQGRESNGLPQLRGMTPVGHLNQMGANVSFGADNVRDGFCAFGEFDPMAVLNLGAQIGHLDEPGRDWSALVTKNPALSMGLDWNGELVSGAPADLVLFSARSSGELSARGEAPKIVIRNGKWLNERLPDYRELNQ